VLHDLLTHTAGFVYRLWDSEALKYYKAVDKLPAKRALSLPFVPIRQLTVCHLPLPKTRNSRDTYTPSAHA